MVAESMLVKHQLLILSRGRKRAPNLCAADRIITGLCTLLMRRMRVLRSAIVLKPSTLLNLHKLLTKRKYRLLFSPRHGHRPGPKGPKQDVIDAVVAMKRRNVLGLSSHRPADQASFRPRDRQGCCSPHPERPLPAGIGFGRSVLAHLSRSHEGQFVELRFVPMPIRNLENTLGSRCDGPMYATYHRV